MTDKLLPCPFCGGEAIVVKTESCGRYIGCWDCGGRTEEFETDYAGSARDKSTAAWNRRAKPDAAPVVRGEWISMGGCRCDCSVCGGTVLGRTDRTGWADSAFCGYCGAKMEVNK